jgi:predicted MFS family arabinose efflux permease
MSRETSRWSILAVLSLIRLSFGYQFQSMAALAPVVSHDLGLDQTQVGTLIGLDWGAGVAVALPGGWLASHLGDKPMVLAGGVLTVLGGVMCALGESYGALAAGRVIAGLGGIVMNVLSVKMATDWFAGREIGFAMGALFGCFPLGIGLGLALQAPLADAIGWSAVMGSTAGLAALVLLAMALVYHAPARLAKAPAGALQAHGERLGWTAIGVISIAGIGLAVYNGSFLVYVSYAPMLLTANGLEVAQAGAILAAASVVSTVGVPLGGYLADRTHRPWTVLFSATLAFCVCVALMPATAATKGAVAIGALALVVGVLGSLPVSPMVALPSQAIPAGARAVGLGIFYTWFYLGATLCPALGGWLYDRAGTPAAPVYLNAGLGVAAIVLYLAFAAAGRQRLK